MNQKAYNRIKQIILKSLRDNLNDDEEMELNDWKELSGSNKSVFNRINDFSNWENYLDIQNQISVDSALEKNKKQRKQLLNRRIRISIMRYAAAIILLVSSGIYLKNSKILDKDKEEIVAGCNKAKLILSNGEEIELGDNAKISKIKQDGNSEVYINSKSIKYNKIDDSDAKIAFNKIIVPRGGEFSIDLPDGTKMWVNSESEVTYPTSFNGNTREINVTGEVYLQVAHNKHKPFIVNTNRGKVKVLGTSFNLRNYNDETTLITTLVEGSVQIDINNEEYLLKPGKQCYYNTVDKKVVLKMVKTSIYTSWFRGRFVFSNQRLESILKDMSRWYDIEIEFEDTSDKNILFTGNIKRYEDFNSVIYMLELMNKVKFEIEGRKLIIKH
jgi:ferric-dicitrate binding protein FerR (iron transport regulator)